MPTKSKGVRKLHTETAKQIVYLRDGEKRSFARIGVIVQMDYKNVHRTYTRYKQNSRRLLHANF